MRRDTIRERGRMSTPKADDSGFSANVTYFSAMVGGNGVRGVMSKAAKGADPAWFLRWEAAILAHIAKTGESLASLSIRSGCAKSYLSNTLGSRTIPAVNIFLAVCEAIDVNQIYVLQGVEWTEDHARIARAFARFGDRGRQSMGLFLESLDQSED